VALLTAVSFFSGYAGIDLGLKRVIPSLRTICYVEVEAFAAANLVAKIQGGLLDDAPIWSDIATFDYASWRGMVGIAHGGVPCQPHSVAGSRRGGSDDRFLFDIWIDGLALMRPGLVFIENVDGLLTSRMPDGTLCIRHILRRLEDIGYRVEDDSGKPLVGIFSAAEVGAPHRRKRVFILAESDSVRHGRIAQRITAEIDKGSGGTPERRSAMADTRSVDDPRLPDGGRKTEHGVEHSCNDMENANECDLGAGCNEWRDSIGERPYDEPSRPSEGSADTISARPQIRRSEPGDNGEECATAERIRLPEFPPGPGELERWIKLPDGLWPSTTPESKFRGFPDGNTNRLDRLRLAGNGVVPATVAKAFVTLWKKLEN